MRNFCRTTITVLLLLWASFAFTQDYNSDTYIQGMERFKFKDTFQNLYLKEAVEQGLRKNNEQELREIKWSLLEIEWGGAYEKFWFPNLKLKLSSGNHVFGRVQAGKKPGGGNPRTPPGTLGLEFEEYTLFNWGIDYLDYVNKLAVYTRGKELLSEEKRVLKHNIMIHFFKVLTLKKIERIRKEQLRHASFIYRLNREKVAVAKVSKQEYYQARAEYLQAQDSYHKSLLASENSDEEMALLIGHDAGTRYIIKEHLLYKKINTNYTDAIKFVEKKNSDILNAMVQLETSKRDYEKARRESLPLPKFSVNLGAYTQSFGGNHSRDHYETSPDNSNIELMASVNATWDLAGENGFLNSRKRAISLVKKQISEKMLENTKEVVKSRAKEILRKIANYQSQVLVLSAKTSNLKKLFDIALNNYMKRKTSFVNLSNALRERIDSGIDYAWVIFEHAKNKILLATEMGVEDFPGENFENLANMEGE